MFKSLVIRLICIFSWESNRKTKKKLFNLWMCTKLRTESFQLVHWVRIQSLNGVKVSVSCFSFNAVSAGRLGWTEPSRTPIKLLNSFWCVMTKSRFKLFFESAAIKRRKMLNSLSTFGLAPLNRVSCFTPIYGSRDGGRLKRTKVDEKQRQKEICSCSLLQHRPVMNHSWRWAAAWILIALINRHH